MTFEPLISLAYDSSRTMRTFVDGCTVEQLQWSAGEALLAVALTTTDAERRKAAVALIKKAKAPRLMAALAALPKRVYEKDDGTLAEDLVRLASIDGLCMPQVAFHIGRLQRHDALNAYVGKHVPSAYARSEVTRDGYCSEPLEPEVYLSLVTETAALSTVKSLRFLPPEDAALPDLTGFDGTLRLHGPIASLGTNELAYVRELYLVDSPLTSLPPMPRLRVLSIHGGMLERLPSAKELGALKELELVRAVHLTALPDDIGKLQALKKVVVVGCGLRTVPDSLGKAKLDLLRLDDMTMETLPDFEGATPAKTVITSLRLETAPSEHATRFLQLASSHTLLLRLASILEHVRALPTFAARLSEHAAGKDASSVLPELLVAAACTHIDVEHGASSNAYWMGVVGSAGGPVEQAVSKAIAPCVRGEEDLAAARAKMASIKGFDGELFAALVRDVWASERHAMLRAEWH